MHRTHRRALSLFAAFLCLGFAGCGQPTNSTEDASAPAANPDTVDVDARAVDLAQRMLIVDTHIDVPYRLLETPADVSNATDDGDFDYPRAVAGGLNALFMSIYIPAEVDAQGGARELADSLIDSTEQLATAAPAKFSVATCTADIGKIKDSGRIALALGMENGGPIEGSFDTLTHFRDRGIRYITLAHSKSNHISDSSYDEDERWEGLSEFGKTLIPEMNRQGVMVDVSHITDRAYWQVLELTAVPVIASHSSLRHFTPDFKRNMSDEMVAALKGNGGVIQINFGSSFLTAEARGYGGKLEEAARSFGAGMGLKEDDPLLAKFAADYRVENPYPYATVDDVLDHIDRAVSLAGIDHVGLGSDYDGVGDSLPVGLKDVSEYPNLVAGLLERDYSETDIEKILSGNLMRVWRQVEAYATQSGHPPSCTQS